MPVDLEFESGIALESKLSDCIGKGIDALTERLSTFTDTIKKGRSTLIPPPKGKTFGSITAEQSKAISDILDGSYPPGKINMPLGFHDFETDRGFGYAHIYEKHKVQIAKKTGKTVKDLAVDVGNGFSEIRKGRRGSLVLILVEGSAVEYIELSQSGTGYIINSLHPATKITKIQERFPTLLWERSANNAIRQKDDRPDPQDFIHPDSVNRDLDGREAQSIDNNLSKSVKKVKKNKMDTALEAARPMQNDDGELYVGVVPKIQNYSQGKIYLYQDEATKIDELSPEIRRLGFSQTRDFLQSVFHNYDQVLGKKEKELFFLKRIDRSRSSLVKIKKVGVGYKVSEVKPFVHDKRLSAMNLHVYWEKEEPATEGVNQVKPTKAMVDYFEERTAKHIQRTANNLDVIIKAFPDLDKMDLEKRKTSHDASKYGDEEREPYIWNTEFHRMKNQGKEFAYPAGMEDKVKAATKHHITMNRHHPEAHKAPSDMSDEDIAEMVADWAAMSQELGTGLKSWADEKIGKKWKFTKEQSELIYRLIDIFEEPATEKAFGVNFNDALGKPFSFLESLIGDFVSGIETGPSGDKVHPSAVEYIQISLRKGKKIKAAINQFFKKNPQGSQNYMLGGTVNFGPDELEDAVMRSQAKSAINGAMKMKEGMGHISLAGQADSHNLDKDELAKYIKKVLNGSDGNGILKDYPDLNIVSETSKVIPIEGSLNQGIKDYLAINGIPKIGTQFENKGRTITLQAVKDRGEVSDVLMGYVLNGQEKTFPLTGIPKTVATEREEKSKEPTKKTIESSNIWHWNEDDKLDSIALETAEDFASFKDESIDGLAEGTLQMPETAIESANDIDFKDCLGKPIGELVKKVVEFNAEHIRENTPEGDLKEGITLEIKSIGRKWIKGTYPGKTFEYQIPINDISKNFKPGERYTFDAVVNVERSKYGTKATVTPIDSSKKVQLKADNNESEVERWLGYVEGYIERGDGYLYPKGMDKLKELGIEKYPELQKRLEEAIAKAEKDGEIEKVEKLHKQARKYLGYIDENLHKYWYQKGEDKLSGFLGDLDELGEDTTEYKDQLQALKDKHKGVEEQKEADRGEKLKGLNEVREIVNMEKINNAHGTMKKLYNLWKKLGFLRSSEKKEFRAAQSSIEVEIERLEQHGINSKGLNRLAVINDNRLDRDNPYDIGNDDIADIERVETKTDTGYSNLTDNQLLEKAQQYDDLYNEGGEGFNPYRDELEKRTMAELSKEPETLAERKRKIMKQIELKDSSVAREFGTYNKKEIDALRAEVEEIEREEEKRKTDTSGDGKKIKMEQGLREWLTTDRKHGFYHDPRLLNFEVKPNRQFFIFSKKNGKFKCGVPGSKGEIYDSFEEAVDAKIKYVTGGKHNIDTMDVKWFSVTDRKYVNVDWR